MKIEIQQSGIAEMIAALTGAGDKVRRAWTRTAYEMGAKGVALIVRTYRGAKETSDIATAVRSGRLWRSYGHEVRETPTGIDLDLGVLRSTAVDADVLKYAPVHEYGATIRAKNGKYLAIPLDAAKTAAGVVRGLPRSFPDTFVRTSKAGHLLIFQKQGKEAVPLFALVRQVTIKPRPSLEPAKDKILPELQERLYDDVRRVAEGQ